MRLSKASIILLIAQLLAGSITVYAQTAAEIATARAVARQMGYSEKDINAILGAEPIGSATLAPETAAATATAAATPAPETIELEQAAKPADAAAAQTNTIYGQDYFLSPGLGKITSYIAPAPSSYILGPGDEVIVDIWGATVSHIAATVQNDGSINLSELGPVYLAGMTLESAEASLKSQLTRIYAGLDDERADTFVKISIGKMKGVVINVSGEVVTPGIYTLPSLASLPSAIYMAGGLKNTGSVRNIKLYRKGKVAANFDLYAFLFHGKVDENLRLQDGDVIKVEPYGDVASISGAVVRPMKYEFRKGETVSDIIAFAGNFTTDAQRDAAHVSRKGVVSNQDFDLKSEQFATFALVDGDDISVRRYLSNNENSVKLAGPVKYPGTYALGETISDVASLVNAAGGLIEGAFTGFGQINRLDENRQPTYVTFDLAKVLTGEEKVPLKREDNVVIYSNDDFVANQSVKISGSVMKPGQYSFHTGMTLSELLALAGGLSPDAYLARGIISHESVGGAPVVAPFNVLDAGDVILMRNDAVRIYSIRELKQDATVKVLGEVNAPGEYCYREGITVGDLVELAMGFTDGVDMSNVQISSRGGRTRGDVVTHDFASNPALLNTVLQPYDIVSFRRLTYFREQVSINVEGEVVSPGDYVLNKSDVRISDVMARTGGFTEEAYPHGAKLIRVLTEEERERQMEAVIAANKSLEGEKTEINLGTLLDRYTIGIDIEEAIKNPGSTADVVLRSGDIIKVPQMNNTVKVSGGVLYPNTVVYEPNLGWKDYVNEAGGFTKRARKGKTFAVYMNGKVAAGDKIYMEPGMEIVVPERLPSEETKLTPVEIASLATSTTSIATLVATIINLFK